MYLNGPSCRVDDPVVSVLGPVHPELLEDVRDCHQHAATHDQLLPCQHILQQGDSQADSVMVQAGGVQGGTTPTQVTEEGGTEIATVQLFSCCTGKFHHYTLYFN